MNESNQQPPKWADRFLAWYCSAKVREQVQGDAHELFYWRLEKEGYFKAKRAFLWDVIRLFKWSNIKRRNRHQQKINDIAMFKNYFKIGLRNLWKQKMPSTINVIGLSLAIGCCLVVFKFIEYHSTRDQFHEKGDRIFLTTHTARVDQDLKEYGYISLGLVDRFVQDYPGINRVVKYSGRGVEVKMGSKTFNEFGVFTNHGFFDTFSFGIIHGDKTTPLEPNQVALASATAERYFGQTYAIGEVISISFEDKTHEFEVALVYEEAPNNSSLRPELILEYDWLKSEHEIKQTNVHAFLEIKLGVDKAELIQSLQSLVTLQNDFNPDHEYEEIRLESIETMAKNSDRIEGGLGIRPPMAPMILLSFIGVFVLVLATFNYINIATMMATKRVKEIGVRKVIGSSRRQLITQFLTENFILVLISVIVGCLLAASFFLPQFNNISGSSFQLDLLTHTNLWIFLISLLFFITLASGTYPAFFVSSFKAVTIFKGSEKIGGRRRFMGIFLTFQFTLSIITIVAGIVATQTSWINHHKSWGFNQDNKLVIPVPSEYYSLMFEEARSNPLINDLAGSSGSIGMYYDYQPFKVGENEVYGGVIKADAHYVELLEISLHSGRYFDEAIVSDYTSSVLVNQQFMHAFGLEDDGLHTLTFDSSRYQIIGVLDDFHYASISDAVDPAVVFAVSEPELNHITIKADQSSLAQIHDQLEARWKALGIEGEFISEYQSDAFKRDFEDMKGMRNVLIFVASLAILLSSMGLFGLVSLSISSNIKIYGIKKVLGASAMNLSKDVYRRFVLILSIAILIGSTIAVKLVALLIDSAFGTHEPIGLVPIGLAAFILIGVAALTINTQLMKVRRMNPAQTLRTE